MEQERDDLDLFTNYENEGRFKILIGVATEFSTKTIHCINGIDIVYGSDTTVYNAHSKPVADNYNEIVEYAIKNNYDFLITVEDDTYPPKDAFTKLVKLALDNPKTVVAGWYTMKEPSRQGVHIELRGGIKRPVEADGKLHDACMVAMGCTIFPVEMFKKIDRPWFKTLKDYYTQDVYFSRVAKEAGYHLLVDTSIVCKHLDIKTATVY